MQKSLTIISCISQVMMYIKIPCLRNNLMKTAIQKNGKIDPINVVADSHVGLVRERNEDSYVYYVSEENINTFIAVADGIGGHEGGEIASALCMKTMAGAWRNSKLGKTKSVAKLKKFLISSLTKSNKLIYDLNKSFNVQHPMGTTAVAATLTPDKIIVAHAGDSRCYRLRNGVIDLLTEDHSYVAELVKSKLISPDEAKNHPFAHIISRSIGPIKDVDLEINIYDRKPGDRYLLCSDGLNVHLDDIEIETILYDAVTAYDASKKLLYTALRGGGEDNITVLCVFT